MKIKLKSLLENQLVKQLANQAITAIFTLAVAKLAKKTKP